MKFLRFKRIICFVCASFMFFNSVSAVYTYSLLSENTVPGVMRLPIYDDKLITLSSTQEQMYRRFYAMFFIQPYSSDIPSCTLPEEVFQREKQHIEATVRSMVALKGITFLDGGKKWASDIEYLTTTYAYDGDMFAYEYVTFAVNFAYSFIGFLLEEATYEEVKNRPAMAMIYFCNRAYDYARDFCLRNGERVPEKISVDGICWALDLEFSENVN